MEGLRKSQTMSQSLLSYLYVLKEAHEILVRSPVEMTSSKWYIIDYISKWKCNKN